MKDFYWDIRPKPQFGTIELRVCDAPLSVERAVALACYLQALCRFLLERSEPAPVEDDYLVYNYNRFQSCHFGLDGVIVDPKSHEGLSLHEDVLATLRPVRHHAEALGGQPALGDLYRTASEGSDAAFLRIQYAKRGSVEGMVDAAIQAFRA